MDAHPITVIIPTSADVKRADLTRRCLDSVLDQDGVDATPLLVVNGPADGFDASKLDPRVNVLRLDKADLPAAVAAGRAHVETPFFSIIDDDDYLLPGALAHRLDILAGAADADGVVTNGYRESQDRRTPLVRDMDAVARDPLMSLKNGNWHSPGSGLFRTERIPLALFTSTPRYLEWTYLAIRLVTEHKLAFSKQFTYAYTEDSPGSISKSDVYLYGMPEALDALLRLEMPEALRNTFRLHRAFAWHAIAGAHLSRGERGAAWKAHLKSLRRYGGLRFLPYTRKLVGLP